MKVFTYTYLTGKKNARNCEFFVFNVLRTPQTEKLNANILA